MDTERTSSWGRPRNRDRDNLDTSPASISTGTVRATLTRSPSGWTQSELQIEIELNVAHSVPEWMDTERTLSWGRPRNRDRDNLDTSPASISTETVRATLTRSPSGWTQRELQIEIELNVAHSVPEWMDTERTSKQDRDQDRDRDRDQDQDRDPTPALTPRRRGRRGLEGSAFGDPSREWGSREADRRSR